MTGVEDCLNCGGDGYHVYVGSSGHFSSHLDAWIPSEDLLPCITCDGTGWVSLDEYSRDHEAATEAQPIPTYSSYMSLEEMVIAHNALKNLDETQLNLLLDTIENTNCCLTPKALYTFNQLKTSLEVSLGCDHPAVMQLRAALHGTN